MATTRMFNFPRGVQNGIGVTLCSADENSRYRSKVKCRLPIGPDNNSVPLPVLRDQ